MCAVGLAAAVGCKRRGEAQNRAAGEGATEAAQGEAPPRVPFEVRQGSTELTFFWFDEHGNAHAVTRVEEVPEGRRQNVRVDPSRPELRAPGWVYVADVRAPGADGRFPVRVVQSEQFAQELAQLNGLAQVMAPPPQPPAAGGAPAGGNGPTNGQPRVVIYGASWCAACHQAANYLRANGIPFVEHDIEREPDAARDMFARAREQGVPTGSIPIIDVNGRLMVGFNPEAIQRALRGG